MNRSQFNKAVVPGLFSFMSSSYQETAPYWKNLVTTKPSRRAYEESAYYAGLGLLPEKPEGEPIKYDDFIQGPTKRWVHKTYALGCRITEEMIEDACVSARYGLRLNWSMCYLLIVRTVWGESLSKSWSFPIWRVASGP